MQRGYVLSKLDDLFLTLLFSVIVGFLFSIFRPSSYLRGDILYILIIIHFSITLLGIPIYFGYWKGSMFENDLTYRLTGWILLLMGIMGWTFFLFGWYIILEFPEVLLGFGLFMIFSVSILYLFIIFYLGAYPFYRIVKGGRPESKFEWAWKSFFSFLLILWMSASVGAGSIIFPNVIQYLSEFTEIMLKTLRITSMIVVFEFGGIYLIIHYFLSALPTDIRKKTTFSLEKSEENKLKHVKELLNFKSGWFFIFLFNYILYSVTPLYIKFSPNVIPIRQYMLFFSSLLLHNVSIAKVLQKKIEGEHLLPYFTSLTIYFIGSVLGWIIFYFLNLGQPFTIISNPSFISSILSVFLAYRKKILGSIVKSLGEN